MTLCRSHQSFIGIRGQGKRTWCASPCASANLTRSKSCRIRSTSCYPGSRGCHSLTSRLRWPHGHEHHHILGPTYPKTPQTMYKRRGTQNHYDTPKAARKKDKIPRRLLVVPRQSAGLIPHPYTKQSRLASVAERGPRSGQDEDGVKPSDASAELCHVDATISGTAPSATLNPSRDSAVASDVGLEKASPTSYAPLPIAGTLRASRGPKGRRV